MDDTKLVTGRHLTQPAIESLYSGVVSIYSIHLILLIAELNDLTIYQADVRNAYLEVYTKEKIGFITRRIHYFWNGRSCTHYI